MVWLMDEINNVVPDDSDKFFRKIFNFCGRADQIFNNNDK